jgi:nucleoprotein TPR
MKIETCSYLIHRCKDLTEQNNLLHQHLESVSSQAARIKQAAGSTSSVPGETETADDTDTKLSELRAVVAYLRKEKEIVDLQFDLSKQENVRLKAQIEHVSHNLEETRTVLSEVRSIYPKPLQKHSVCIQERERAVETAISATQHADLVERINQLNILRESNATLRSDCENYAKRAKELETKLQLLSADLDPAKEQARIAQLELEARDNQIKRLEEENRRWQQRNSQLLSKVGFVCHFHFNS